MPSLIVEKEVEFTVECRKCGGKLEAEFVQGYRQTTAETLVVDACEECLGESFEEGYGDGHDK